MTDFVEVKTQDLSGAALDWAVAKAEKVEGLVTHRGRPAFEKDFDPDCWADDSCLKAFKCWRFYAPSTDWSQGGPLIEKHRVAVRPNDSGRWMAYAPGRWLNGLQHDDAPLIAACRAIVASVLDAEPEYVATPPTDNENVSRHEGGQT